MDSAVVLLAVLVALLLVVAFALGLWAGGRRRHSDPAQGSSLADIEVVLAPVREGLENLRRSSDAAQRERAAAEATLVAQLAGVQERYSGLEASTAQLAAALAGGQTRGQWGEMQLEGLLDHAGLVEGVHYRRQDVRDGGTRPDIVVLLPGGGEVLVDAKFPFDAYWQSMGEDDPTRREVLLRKHAADVNARARELAGKGYSEVCTSPDFVVMFLPLESLLSASLQADGMLLEKAFERRVILATPTSMVALLRTIAFGYQRHLMAQNAEEITLAGAEMLRRLAVLVEHVETLRKGLDTAVRGYNSFVASFDTQALRQARRLSDLGVDSSRPLDSPAAIDASLRSSDSATLRETA